MISRRPDAALYRQLADELRREIHEGIYRPGGRMPGENWLMQRHGVGRDTARKALRELATEGLIDVKPGRGTWVRPVPEQLRMVLQPGTELKVRMPMPAERDEFRLPAGLPVVELRQGDEVSVIAASGITFVVP